jgi:bla regulator protein blaR1
MIETIFSETVIRSLGWTLLHFLWQGVLLGALAAALLAALSQRSAAARYRVGCAVMGLMLLAPMTTFWRLIGDGFEKQSGRSVEAASGAEPPFAAPAVQNGRPTGWEQQAA